MLQDCLKILRFEKSYGNWHSDGPNSVRFYLTVRDMACMSTMCVIPTSSGQININKVGKPHCSNLRIPVIAAIVFFFLFYFLFLVGLDNAEGRTSSFQDHCPIAPSRLFQRLTGQSLD